MNYTHTNIGEYVSLDPYTTLQCGSRARCFAVANTCEEVVSLIDIAHNRGMPVVPLGGGSNMILNSQTIDHFFIKIENRGINIVDDDKESVFIDVSAGESWNDFVVFAVSHGFSGIEALSSIPGTCGATPIQNVGAYGQEVSTVIESVTGYNTEKKIYETILGDACEFGYRDSIFKRSLRGKFIVTKLRFRLSKKDPVIPKYPMVDQELMSIQKAYPNESLLRHIQMTIDTIRSRKLPHPRAIPNVGSFFKNAHVSAETAGVLQKQYPGMPCFLTTDGSYKIASGWLIEHVGYKGKVLDGVGTYEHNALVLINPGRRTGHDILEYAHEIQRAVHNQFGVNLEIEPEIIS